MKRFATFLLALVMILSLATTAFADEVKNDSITINNAKAGETYKLYKMFDLKVNNEITPTAYTYTVISAWADFFKAPVEADGETPEEEAGPGYQYVTINEAGEVTAISNAAALAKAAATWTGKPEAAKEIEAASATVAFTGLEDGYWLITSTLGTIAMAETTPDKEAVTINEKNPEDTIEKKVQEDSTSEWGDENDAQIGDTVNFKSTATLVPATRNVKIHDTMDAGLSYQGDVKVYTDADCKTELATEYYEIQKTPDEGDTFTIKIKDAYIDTLISTTNLYLTYSAVLNENAVATANNATSIVVQENTTKITYGDKQSVEDKTETTTHKFEVKKYADGVEHLAGATFQLKKGDTVIKLIMLDDNNYRVANGNEAGAIETFTTVDDSNIVIWGVDADEDYKLKETVAPTGYNLLKEEKAVTVNADNSTRVDVENKSGTELPSTGGVGTTMFYIFGGILVLAAVVLLVTKKRMATAE